MTSSKIIFLMDDISTSFAYKNTWLFPWFWSKKAFNSIYYGAPYNGKLTRKSFPQWNLKCLWRGKKQESRDVSIIISLINDIFLRHCWTVPYVLKTSGRFRPRHKSNKSNHRILSLERYSEHLCPLYPAPGLSSIWWHKKIKVVHKSIYISL